MGWGAVRGPSDGLAERKGSGSQGKGHSRCRVCLGDSRVTIAAGVDPMQAEFCHMFLQPQHTESYSCPMEPAFTFHFTCKETEARGG